MAPQTSIENPISNQEAKSQFINYLNELVAIHCEALKAYEVNPIDEDRRDSKVKELREIQAIILRDRINEGNRLISVVKNMSLCVTFQ